MKADVADGLTTVPALGPGGHRGLGGEGIEGHAGPGDDEGHGFLGDEGVAGHGFLRVEGREFVADGARQTENGGFGVFRDDDKSGMSELETRRGRSLLLLLEIRSGGRRRRRRRR